ncbi:MAG: hypothetical protein WCK35_28735 [Chloroflexota bacterium]
MFNNYNYLIPEERQSWRSAHEIEIAELKHEERRIQFESMQEDRRADSFSLLRLPMQLLAILFG